jgi:hypothetical protein
MNKITNLQATSKHTLVALVLLFLSSTQLFAQTQTVKGIVIDKQSNTPLIGVTIGLLNNATPIGATTDENGRFILLGIPVGRQAFRLSYIGYNEITVPNIVVTSGKEVDLSISMEESLSQLKEVVIKSETDKDKPKNELATISARSFNMEEVNRFSGGRNDVSHLVSNFAGVATSNDSRNDIVIRGNSPTGVLWRLEGIPIPSPNHFSTLGTTGGPVSALNTNLISNSDFLTSAFPAEYGNANAGVFDINFRSGNKDKLEFTAQLAAFSGFEGMIEGPMGKNNGSFLVAYRYSFAEVANAIGLNIGTKATPKYSDLSFKLDFGNSKAGKFTIFGIGAKSNIAFLGKDVDTTDLFADKNNDSYATSNIGIFGVKHNLLVDKSTYIKTVASFSVSSNQYDDYQYTGTKRIYDFEVKDVNYVTRLSSFINKKFNSRFTLRSGFLLQNMQLDSKLNSRDGATSDTVQWRQLRNYNGSFNILEIYSQGQYRVNDKWTLNFGLHTQYFDFTKDFVAEPRLALNYQFLKGHTLSLGYGLHNQIQPLPVFFFQEQVSSGVFQQTNSNLKFTRSNHFVLGYDTKIGTDWRIKAETYYQYLDKVPVQKAISTFSVLNTGADFAFPEVGSLQNTGTGTNYGLELTVEKFFSKGYYLLFTSSFFNSKYTGSDGVERNTAFNNQYVTNLLAGKEFRYGKERKNAITLDTKITFAGGRFYTPIDLAASKLAGDEVRTNSNPFSAQYTPYFRWDIKIGYSLNSSKRKFSQQFYLDFQNVTNNKNVFQTRYNKTSNSLNTVYQIGFFPDILYRVQF